MNNSGFTVVEMLVTISILAIVLSIGIPSFNAIIRSSDISANSSDMIIALNYARIEAVKRGTSVQLDQRNGASWTGGMVVWVDDDDSMDSGEELRYWDEFTTGSTVASANSVTAFVFSATGEVNSDDTLTLCDSRTGEAGRTITVLSSGAVYAEEFDCD
jgi:type IV fimbrial biogenesis protein FimT